MIVQASSLQTNTKYAVLGDDVIITRSIYETYLSIMTNLGVEISLPKSIISTNYAEFAKRVVDLDMKMWNPIGPGLILQAVRFPFGLVYAVAEFLKTELITTTQALNIVGDTTKSVPSGFGFFVLFGPHGLISHNQHVALINGMSWLSDYHIYAGCNLQFLFYNGVATTIFNI